MIYIVKIIIKGKHSETYWQSTAHYIVIINYNYKIKQRQQWQIWQTIGNIYLSTINVITMEVVVIMK